MTNPLQAGVDHAELLPCPFCGGEARLMDMTKGARKRGYQYVECRTCGVDAGSIITWNTRAAPVLPDRGWRPIESAPGDGKPLLLGNPNWDSVAPGGWASEQDRDRDLAGWINGPTVWMRPDLPKYPDAPAEGGE